MMDFKYRQLLKMNKLRPKDKNQSLFNAGIILFVGIYGGLISDLKWHNLSYCPSLKTPDLFDNKETSITIKLFILLTP